jgi:maltose alpha-D-glucosyltransferase/alpha-amylase
MRNDAKTTRIAGTLENAPLWYKDAVIYEVHPRAFFDSDGDGIGDFRGLAEKLEYLQDLGVTAIWLLPFYPSPLKDDGYDIADYLDVNPAYGTLRDVEAFLREAHRRGLRVITELVLNHTSDQHLWFRRAWRAKPKSVRRDFYVWSDTPKKYSDARIIFKDFETSNWTWHPTAKAYYWHRFYSHQPDLNFDNPAVRQAMLQAVDFWLRLGVDGLRLDAVPYLYERDGTNCENLPETHAFLKQLRQHVDERFSGRMLLAEANQWPEDAVSYFGNGDECHMAFHFPVMPRLFMAIRMEDRYPIIDILEQTPAIPESCQWAMFLRNHDELTLEMVTDEERDYMYQVYAHDRQARINLGIRRRLAPLLGNHRRKIELMNGLLLSLPGTPIIYYGDEIGMGDNIYLGDRNAVRTPMQWSADRNAGFSHANPQRLYLPVVLDPEYHPEALNVETQQENLHSLLWWMKRVIALRKRYRAFGRGALEFLYPDNHKVLAFIRRYQDESILVVANLSRFVQYAEIDLRSYKGLVPVELFGSMEFPAIGAAPYFITLGPHSFYWFALQRPRSIEVRARTPDSAIPVITLPGQWEEVFSGRGKAELESILLSYLPDKPWFGGKARRLKTAAIAELIRIARESSAVCLATIRVGYVEGEPETYLLPLTFAAGDEMARIRQSAPDAVVCQLRCAPAGLEGILYDALWNKDFCRELIDMMGRRRRFKGGSGELAASTTRSFRSLRGPTGTVLKPSILGVGQSNTSVVYGDRMILKFFRCVGEGVNPDLELGLFLTERRSFVHVPPVAGSLAYQRNHAEEITVGILWGFVPNQGDAWRYTLQHLDQFFERTLVRSLQNLVVQHRSLVELASDDVPPLAHDTIGTYLESARLLGQRTAELHTALASEPEDPDFAPEPFSALYQRSLYQSMRRLAAEAFDLLNKQLRHLPEVALKKAKRLRQLEPAVDRRFRALFGRKFAAKRIRCHDDYHLGHILYTGKDFVIIDFEGEPARSLTERRLKRSPLRDVAGMLRSFHYAAYKALFFDPAIGGRLRPEEQQALEPAARFWYMWVAAVFLKAYLQGASGAALLPQAGDELEVLLDIYLLEKAFYELKYELNNRPEWVRIPLRGILELLDTAEPGGSPT